MSKINGIVNKEYTVSQIEYSFNIPIYQRPYAWNAKEVEVLLMDFYNAFESDKESYYIGNIVTSISSEKQDIVDGQQRFTTLFLIGVIAKWDKNIQLEYEIRENDREFLEYIVNNNFKEKEKYDDINSNLIENLKFIENVFENERIGEGNSSVEIKNIETFSQWIYTNVKFILTQLSGDIDVQKYFEVMNNRGVQLEKHHILKANLLHTIDNDDEKKRYAKIWDYCSDMNVYLEEYILKDEDNTEKIKEVRKKLLKNPIDSFDTNNNTEIKLLDILDSTVMQKDIDNEIKKEKLNKKQSYKSIISFETFLLHVYKISYDENIKINDSNLLEIIKIDTPNFSAKKFIKDILEYRILFDYFVFKRDKEQKPKLRTLNDENGMMEDSSLLMIELLFEITSSKFNLWLTEFLKFIKINKDKNEIVKKLEKLDNKEMMKRKGGKNFDNILNQGTSTPHYWFYKLDYILWKDYNWKAINVIKKYSIVDFRFTNLVSIEHIQPQNPEEECQEWGEFDINNFGNLALISNHMNSKLSNQCFMNKKSDIEKQINNKTVESLKMLLLYSKYENWNVENCKTHHEEMVKLLEDSLK